ncbi:kinase mkl2 MAPK-like protein [Branchiostoma belcheri]|nr:kinase mkl2 MAPK-like protein [Branchiostoma belcheri]
MSLVFQNSQVNAPGSFRVTEWRVYSVGITSTWNVGVSGLPWQQDLEYKKPELLDEDSGDSMSPPQLDQPMSQQSQSSQGSVGVPSPPDTAPILYKMNESSSPTAQTMPVATSAVMASYPLPTTGDGLMVNVTSPLSAASLKTSTSTTQAIGKGGKQVSASPRPSKKKQKEKPPKPKKLKYHQYIPPTRRTPSHRRSRPWTPATRSSCSSSSSSSSCRWVVMATGSAAALRAAAHTDVWGHDQHFWAEHQQTQDAEDSNPSQPLEFHFVSLDTSDPFGLSLFRPVPDKSAWWRFSQLSPVMSQYGQQYQPIQPAPAKTSEKLPTSTTVTTTQASNNSTTTTTGKKGGLSNLEDMKVAELKEEARARGLPVSGTKNQLMERLKPYADITTAPVTMGQTLTTTTAGEPASVNLSLPTIQPLQPAQSITEESSSMLSTSMNSTMGLPSSASDDSSQSTMTVIATSGTIDTMAQQPTSFHGLIPQGQQGQENPGAQGQAAPGLSRPNSTAPMDIDMNSNSQFELDIDMMDLLDASPQSQEDIVKQQQKTIEELQRKLEMSQRIIQQHQQLTFQPTHFQFPPVSQQEGDSIPPPPPPPPPNLMPHAPQNFNPRTAQHAAIPLHSTNPAATSESKSMSTPSSPVEAKPQFTFMHRSPTNPLLDQMAPPPNYQEALRQRVHNFNVSSTQVSGTQTTISQTMRSQQMDDLLEILIEHGDLPPSAALEPPPTPKDQPGSSTHNTVTPPNTVAPPPNKVAPPPSSTPPPSPHNSPAPPSSIAPPPCPLPSHVPLPPAIHQQNSAAPSQHTSHQLWPTEPPARDYVIPDNNNHYMRSISEPAGNHPVPELPQDKNFDQQMSQMDTSTGSDPNLSMGTPPTSGINFEGDDLNWLDLMLPSTGLTPLSANPPSSFPMDLFESGDLNTPTLEHLEGSSLRM